ncbi:hypothetical protein BDY19DRAFT_891159 [Irpex rosettiformis]|uniref:Uncharacterized protein n=1 Tax=Irpex rosettiformis TaxID=378272 RepID=A0ACB8U261_9APHY|nr:hypothetical protein BDY19DRAFT_891159 [Irpex rosettiformis]
MFGFDTNLSREELLGVLSSFGIAIPPTSKLPVESLQKRLRQAINASQAMPLVNARPPLDPAQYPKWPQGYKGLFDAIRRGNLQEAAMTQLAMREGQDPSPLYVNAFMDVRQTLMSLANNCETGFKHAVMQDLEKEKCAINLRVVDVYKIDERTPLLIVLYQSFSAANPLPGIQWVQEQMSKHHQMPNVNATELEQKLLLLILEMNSKRLPPGFTVKRLKSEKDFKLSFLLPMGPLSYHDIGKLNLNTGCVVCGHDINSRCSQCQSVAYCGIECQKADWPSHKAACRSLKGGEWTTMPFSSRMPGTLGMIGQLINLRDNFQSNMMAPMQTTDDTPPQNAYGNRLFLIKLQHTFGPGEGTFLIYDRKRTCVVYFLESKAPEVFKRFKAEITGPRGGNYGSGMFKMYRWAKRVGEQELSVCLDKVPNADSIKW